MGVLDILEPASTLTVARTLADVTVTTRQQEQQAQNWWT